MLFRMKNFTFVLSVLTLITGSYAAYGRSSVVEEIFRWKQISYENLPQSENSYVGPYRYYIPENNNMASMAFHPASGLMIVNVFRIRPGIPATLAAFCVQDYSTGSSPKLWGFPNYEVNALRASDFDAKRSLEDSWRKGHKKPNKHHNYYYGQNNYQNNYPNNYYGGHGGHGGHHNNYYGSYPSYYQKPYYKPTPPAIPTTQQPKNSFRIVSTYVTFVDEKCNRAFTVDVGLLNYYNNGTQVIQKPAILVFGLAQDCCQTREFPLIRRSEIPDDVAGPIPFGTLFLKLDYQSSDCDDLFIYITNPFSSQIIVYDYKNDDFWTFTSHPTFAPVIAESHLVYDKTFFYDFPIGVIGIALGYADEYGDRPAYYFPGSSTAQFAVSTEVLKDKRKAPTNYDPDDFAIMGYRGCDHQAANAVIDYTYGVMFYAEMQSNSIRCWNMKKPLNPDNIGVVYESDKLLFSIMIFIDSRGYLWFNTASLPILFFTDDPLNLNEYNNRIFRVKVSDAIRGTVCEDEDDSYRLADLYNDYDH